ncbi:MAG: 50S ribosomal protein L29 [Steroidobacteraceae bacterium]
MGKELKRIETLRADLRKKSAKDLGGELLKLRKAQFALRLQRGTGQTVKPDQFSKTRRDVARLKTVQRELSAAKGSK